MEQLKDEFTVMNPAVVKKTQEMLGRVIKKPALTENLLTKPPFRYLHDIVSEVIRTTGFMKDLYEENELNSDNVKDKQSKIAFLQKAIDVVMLVSGKALMAKPAHIVAGHQPEKTNELLQAIAKCCLKKVPSDHAVKRVLGKKKVDMKTKASTSTSEEKRKECEHHLSREDRKKTTKHSCSGDHIPDQPEDQQHLRRDWERKHHRVSKCSDSVKDYRQKCVKYKSQDQVQDKDRDKERQKERKSDRGRQKDKQWDNKREMTRERDSPRDLERNEKQQRRIGRKQHKDREEGNKTVNGKSKARVSGESEGWEKTAKPVQTSDISGRKPQPSNKRQGKRCKIGKYDDSVSEGNRHAQLTQSFVLLENVDDVGSIVPSDMASSRKHITQPSRACPATPWIKSQKTYPGMISTGRLLSAIHPVPIIMDREGEDKQFVKEVAVHLIPRAPNMEAELSSSFLNSKEQNWVSEAAWKKNKDAVTREIEWLQSSIQKVCCSFLPLGKSMDNIQEHTDAMVAEHHTWQQVNAKHAQALLEEQRATDSTLDPLKAELAELEQLIADQLNKMCAVKSNILKNEEKIQKMVTGINISC